MEDDDADTNTDDVLITDKSAGLPRDEVTEERMDINTEVVTVGNDKKSACG